MYREEQPSIKDLKSYFIDANENNTSADMLDCVARMIISIESPKDTVRIALEFMGRSLNVCRADAGFATPTDINYSPLSDYSNPDSHAPGLETFVMSNQHSSIQKVWQEDTPVKYEDIENNPLLEGIRDPLLQVECKSMMMQRLVWDGEPIGISCVDHSKKHHTWMQHEVEFMHHFCTTFFAPLAGISNYWHNPTLHQMFKKPSKSELEAIKLAAKGMSYKQIADELGKSVRTIDNQLRDARRRLNVTNQVELIRKCAPWLG
ncbi:MAG: LuxR C-terminal-related transcriptional regulator [Gammaproteobacteria bacterium]